MAQATATTEARAPFGEGRPSRAGPRELARDAVAGKGKGRGRGAGGPAGPAWAQRGRGEGVLSARGVPHPPQGGRVNGTEKPGVRQGAPDRSEDPGSQGSSRGSSGGRDSCTGSGSIAGRGHRCQRRSRKPPDTTRAAGGLGTSALDP